MTFKGNYKSNTTVLDYDSLTLIFTITGVRCTLTQYSISSIQARLCGPFSYRSLTAFIPVLVLECSGGEINPYHLSTSICQLYVKGRCRFRLDDICSNK